MKENTRGVVIHDNEKRQMLGPHASFCVHASGIPYFYDGTDAYVTRQENDHYGYHNAATIRQENNHYVYPNAATVAIPKQVSDINSYQRMLARQERGPRGVRTGWWVHTRTCGPCVEQ